MYEVSPPFDLGALDAPDAVAAWAAGAAPSGIGVQLVSSLDPARLSHDGRVDAVVALEKAKSWLEAQQVRLLAAIQAEPPIVADRVADPDKRWRREELACALRVSPTSVASRLGDAAALSALPAALELLAAGAITPVHTRVLIDATALLDDAVTARIAERVLGRAPEQTVARFRVSVRRAVLALVPGPQDEVCARARADRQVRFTPADYAMTSVWALLPAEDAAVLQSTLDGLAALAAPGDDRTLDQRRADALVGLAAVRLHDSDISAGPLRLEHGRRPSIQVTVALSTLIGMDEQPAELDGHGPIPAALARRIAADPTGTWRRLVTDDRGVLARVGSARGVPTSLPPPPNVAERDAGLIPVQPDHSGPYRPSRVLSDAVFARDVVCRFPGCNRRARRCELDHLRPHGQGGRTTRPNLQALCRRHHHLKHEASWRVCGDADVETVWTDPAGRRYRSRPRTHPVDRTMRPNDAATEPPPF